MLAVRVRSTSPGWLETQLHHTAGTHPITTPGALSQPRDLSWDMAEPEHWQDREKPRPPLPTPPGPSVGPNVTPGRAAGSSAHKQWAGLRVVTQSRLRMAPQEAPAGQRGPRADPLPTAWRSCRFPPVPRHPDSFLFPQTCLPG